MKRSFFLILVIPVVMIMACGSDLAVTETDLDTVVLFDQKGRQWNITQSIHRFGFEPGKYQFGVGRPDTVLIAPNTVGNGERGYPEAADSFALTGVVLDRDPRAYRRSDLLGFVVVNDILAGRAIVVVEQPILGASAAYLRTSDDVTLTLSASGWAYDDRLILTDLQSLSMWYRLPGTTGLTCINGEYFGNVLEEVPATIDTWQNWFGAYPNTRLMVLPGATR